MTTVSATEAKQRFAALLDAAQRGPVRIQRHDRDVAVLVSAEEYEQINRSRWIEFNRLSEAASAQAAASELNEDALSRILADQ